MQLLKNRRWGMPEVEDDNTAEVCIVTPYQSNNYGTRLQSYALGLAISRAGRKVTYLNSFGARAWLLMHPSLLLARLVSKAQGKRRKEFFSPSPYVPSEERVKRMREFTDTNYYPAKCSNMKEWQHHIQHRTIFVAGSDIIWQPAWGYPTKYFLDFAVTANLPCFSYASSIGAQEIPKAYHRAYRSYLSRFVRIGVREEQAANLLEPVVGRQITRVADPTLLLERADWDEFSQRARMSKPISDGGFILCYFVMDDSRYWEFVARVQASIDLPVVVLPMHESDELQPYEIITDGTPYEFVWLIKHSAVVLTDSFHACCMSLQYEKEFYLMRRARKDEDAKYDEFLDRYELRGRVVDENEPFTRRSIDYTSASKRLAEERAMSFAFINDALTSADALRKGN